MTWVVSTLAASTPPAHTLLVKQIHSGLITWADEATLNTNADGIAARAAWRQPFLVRSADCLPLVIMTDAEACALHVSRKSLLAGLLDRVQTFIDPPDISRVHIGPHICSEHFVFEHIGEEIAQFASTYPDACRQTLAGLHVSLRQVIDQYLRQWGVAGMLVECDTRCTFESLELPSYRRTLRDRQKLAGNIYTIVRSAW